ncbi:hypothetical protein C7391_1406 [Methanimicrococcus blatticola]|uniref:Uncharacterized protein n=1 Tax=Methanimicrococcus blatticola TaxID=91560 RepID=A0A484F4L8_9EURY|nr:hypothetical protein C7391_1406 [Methanimicrococcus blatticola]
MYLFDCVCSVDCMHSVGCVHLLLFRTPVRLRERNCCYLPFAFATVTCRLHLPLSPAVCVCAVIYRLRSRCHLEFAFATATCRLRSCYHLPYARRDLSLQATALRHSHSAVYKKSKKNNPFFEKIKKIKKKMKKKNRYNRFDYSVLESGSSAFSSMPHFVSSSEIGSSIISTLSFVTRCSSAPKTVTLRFL